MFKVFILFLFLVPDSQMVLIISDVWVPGYITKVFHAVAAPVKSDDGVNINMNINGAPKLRHFTFQKIKRNIQMRCYLTLLTNFNLLGS